MDFKTNEGVMEIFRNLNGLGTENCIFVAFKDTTKQGMKYGALGGAVGGAIAAAAAFSSGVIEGLEGFDGLLINQTESGLGIIPLKNKGIQLMLNPDKMEAQIDKYSFIPNENIEEIIVKNFNIFNKKAQKIKLKIGGKTLDLMARINEKTIPYQEANFTKFMNKYKKK